MQSKLQSLFDARIEQDGRRILIEQIQVIQLIIMSNYTFTFPQDVYCWLVSDNIIPNKGQINDKNMVSLPAELNPTFENGKFVADIIRTMLMKSGQQVSSNISNVKNQNNKNAKVANWNFIWLTFDDLRMQFDSRIKDLIIQGEDALISQIIKQLYDRDENRDQNAMKSVVIAQKMQQSKVDLKNKTNKTNANSVTNVKPHALDIKKINTQKDPNDSQSSLQFLILLLTSSFNMPTEEILGLFTNQNKYLAHLIVKGINEDFTGVILFYTLLNKYSKKLKQFCDSDKKDAESCFYAIKPGLISKNPQVTELCIEVFLRMRNIYDWFVSDTGKCSTTLFLGMKRHLSLVPLYWDLLLHLIQNEQIEFFTKYFKKCFKDAQQMIEVCGIFMSSMANSFMKDKIVDLGILQEWIDIANGLFESGIEQKLISFKFIGQILRFLPDVVDQNDECLMILKKSWKQRPLIEFIYLFDEIILVLQDLAGEKNTMARKVYQIIIQIFDAVIQSEEKKEYLIKNFTQILPEFPKIPTQFLIENYKDTNLKTHDFEFIKCSINLSTDPNCLSKIGETILQIFISQATLNYYLAPFIYTIAKKSIHDEVGKAFIYKAIKDLLQCFANIQTSKKIPQVAKQQQMYFNKRGNSEKVTQQDEDSYAITQKSAKNLLILVDKLTELTLASNADNLQKQIKQQLLDTSAFIKKHNNKVANKGILSVLAKRFAVSKQEESAHEEDYRLRKSINQMQESLARKKLANSSSIPMSSSRYGGPQDLKKQFNEVVQKRKKEQEERKREEQKLARQDHLKKLLVKKQLQKTNLLRGFAQQAELKEDGFWAKFNKEDKQQIEIYPTSLIEGRDLEYIQNLFKKYHRVLRSLFFRYTSSMYNVKSVANFEDNKERNETLSMVQLIKFLKDFKLMFLTNNVELQNLVRDLNVKLLNKRQTQDLDFHGFEQFIIQFCALIYTKTHTINANTSKGVEAIRKSLGHLSHLQLVEEWFSYLKLVFIEKGQKTAIFDEPEAAYFNQTQVIKEFNRKIEEDPSFILPQGYKKVTEKVMTLAPKISDRNSKIKESYADVFLVLDQILHQSVLQMHLIEPLIQKTTKTRVKPHAFINVKAKLMEAGQSKVRAFSSVIQKKTVIPPIKMLEKKTLSFGMKLGLSYVNYKDKLLGEQVAYVIDDMLTAVQNGRNTIEKEKIVNEILKKKNQMMEKEKISQMEKEKKRLQRKNQLQKMRKEITEKKEKQAEQTKDERERKKQKQLSKEKKIKEDKEKYLQEQKKKIQEKRKQEEEQEKKKKDEQSKKKQEEKKKNDKFKEFNAKQIEKFKKGNEQEIQKRKKEKQMEEIEKKKKEDLVRKLRTKIHESDKKAIEIKQKTNEQINELYNSQPIKAVFKEFQPNLRGLFEFLLKNTFVSLTQKKVNNEIIFQTWHYFNFMFQLTPLIINAKTIMKIFRGLIKDKQMARDYYVGLTFEEFQLALLRVAIKHKSIFNKLAEKIKDTMTEKEINEIVEKDIEQKEKNEFEEPKQIDVKGLMKEEDIKKEFTDHYGDISKVTDKTLKGLIYYLKVPKDKLGQQNRFRQITASKVKYNVHKQQLLKQKLNEEYSLVTQPKKKKKKAQSNEQTLEQSVEKAEQNKQIQQGQE